MRRKIITTIAVAAVGVCAIALLCRAVLRPNPIARRVKLADLEDNMDIRRMIGVTPKDMERLARYRRAWSVLQQEIDV